MPPPPLGFSGPHESLSNRPSFLIFLPNWDLLFRRHRQKTAIPMPINPAPVIQPMAIPATCPLLRAAEAFFSPCPPTMPSGTLVLVLVSVVAAVVSVNARLVGSVVKISARDDVDDLSEVADGLVVRLIVEVAVGMIVDLVIDGLGLDSEVGSVTSVVGSDIDD